MFTEDLTVFFDTDEFGVSATFSGISSAVGGILDKEYVEITAGRVPLAGYKPTFTCATAAVSSVAVGTSVTISSVAYTVAHKEDDGTGITKVILEKS